MSTKKFLQSGKDINRGANWGYTGGDLRPWKQEVGVPPPQFCAARHGHVTRNTAAPLKDKLITVVPSYFSGFQSTFQTKCVCQNAWILRFSLFITNTCSSAPGNANVHTFSSIQNFHSPINVETEAHLLESETLLTELCFIRTFLLALHSVRSTCTIQSHLAAEF
jgi:hypothetical protein